MTVFLDENEEKVQKDNPSTVFLDEPFSLKDALLAPVGVGESALRMLTGMGAPVVAGYTGLSSLIGAQGLGAAEKATEKVAESLTYEPKTKVGQAISGVIEYPFQKLAEAGSYLGGKVAESPSTQELLGQEFSAALGAGISTGVQALPLLIAPAAKSVWGRATPKGSVAKTVGKWNGWNEFWKPFSTLPERDSYLIERYKTLGKINIAEDEMLAMQKNLLKNYTPDERTGMFEYLRGVKNLEELPEKSQAISEKMRILNDTIGEELVKRNMIPEESFLENKGKYVHYMYLKHLLGEEGNRLTLGSSGRMIMDTLKQRGKYSDEVRRAWGWIEDAGYAEPIGAIKSLSDIAKFDLMDTVQQNPYHTIAESIVEIKAPSLAAKLSGDIPLTGLERAKGTVKVGIGKLSELVDKYREMKNLQPKNENIAQALSEYESAYTAAVASLKVRGVDAKSYTQMPVSKHYGSLSGAVVHRSIYNDLVPLIQGLKDYKHFGPVIQTAIDLERKSFQAFKTLKTALNVPTMAKNTVSNMIQLNISGIPLYDLPGLMLKAVNSYSSKDAAYVAARKHGLFKTNWGAAEVGEVLNIVKTMEPGKANTLWRGMLHLSKFYGKIDDFFKLTKFIDEQQKGTPLAQSIIEAHRWGMDYSIASPAIKWARRHVMPFVSYQYKIAPLILEAAQKRPWVLAKYATLPFIFNEGFKQYNDIDQASFNRMVKGLPENLKENPNFVPMPFKDSKGTWQWADMENFFPWQSWMKAVRNVTGKNGNILEIPSDMGFGNPVFDIATMLRSTSGGQIPRDPYYNKPIYSPVDPPSEKMGKLMEWMYNRWAPSMLTQYGALGNAAKIGEVDKYGHPITIGKTAGKLFGLNIRSVSPRQGAAARAAQDTTLKRELQKVMRDQSIPREKKHDYIIEYMKQRRRVYED